MFLKLLKKEMLNIFFIIVFVMFICIDAYQGTLFATPLSCVLNVSAFIIIIVDSYIISKTYKKLKATK